MRQRQREWGDSVKRRNEDSNTKGRRSAWQIGVREEDGRNSQSGLVAGMGRGWGKAFN